MCILALTVVFDVKILFDSTFRQYLIETGVSGLYGGAIGGLAAWINSLILNNGIVLGVIAGSAFGPLRTRMYFTAIAVKHSPFSTI